MSSIKYRPEIDGLRAIAVIPVILFHFSNDLLPGGYIGVDVFFVISGFLITSIIIDEYERGVFSFSSFWLRRIRRILPALMGMVIVTLGVGSLILYATDVNELGTQGLAALLSFSNISHWIIAGNYWGGEAESSPLLHTWSLSVEEQFYLLFPLIIFIVLKYFPRRLFLVFFLLSLSSLLLFFFGTQIAPSATFYFLPTRAWELGVGTLLAILLIKGNIKLKNQVVFAITGILIVLMSYLFISGKEGVSPFLIIPIFGTALIIAFARDTDSFIHHSLSLSPVVYIGKISFSLYLWHWPILVLSKQLSLVKNIEIHTIFLVAMILIVSILSYHFIEVPTRRNKKIVPYILTVLLIGIACSYFLKTKFLMEKISFYNKTEWHGNQYNVTPGEILPKGKRMDGITVADRDSVYNNAFSSGGIKKLYGRNKPDIIVLGDSHALMWARVLDEIARELSLSISFYSANGTRTFFSIPPIEKNKRTLFFTAKEKYIFDTARLKYLTEWKPKIIVISSAWYNVNKEETDDLIHFISRLGSKVLLIEQPPVLFFGDKNTPQYLSYLGLIPIENSKQYIRHIIQQKYLAGIQLVKQMAKENNHISHVAISDLFLSNDKTWVLDSNEVLYIDDDHLSYSGALKAKNRIFVALKKILNESK